MAKEPHLKEQAENQETGRTEYRQISSSQLTDILEAHRKYLLSNEMDGEKADLSFTDLQNINLSESNLKYANLRGANLQNADLRETNLQKADLKETNLQKARLEKSNLHKANLFGAKLQMSDLSLTCFRDANLQNSKLTNAKNLMTGQLAGTNVSNAELPNGDQQFKEVIDIVAEASKNSRKLFVIMLLGCAYVLLSIATTTDVRLLTNSGSSPLPIIGAQIPIVLFYLFSPFLLLGMYGYFHLYTQCLWEGLAELPAIFCDGRPLDMKAYPWLLTRLVRTQLYQLKKYHPPLSKLQKLISFFLAWMLVPFTLICLWLRYLPRQDWIGSTLHIIFFTASVWAAVMSYCLAMGTLRGDIKEKALWEKPLKKFKMYKRSSIPLAMGLVIMLLSLASINGTGIHNESMEGFQFEQKNIKTWAPYVLGEVRLSPYANLVDKEVSTKLSNWSQKEGEVLLVKSAPLYRGNLRSARAVRAFLVKADLREADLRHALLVEANLKEANLEGANIEGANLKSAKLEGALLRGVNTKGAGSESGERLKEAFNETPLSDNKLNSIIHELSPLAVDFTEAYLKEAVIENASLPKATFREAKLQQADLSNANLILADLWGAKLEEAILKETQLIRADLEEANLNGAHLESANLYGAQLGSATLEKAYLEAANLQETNLWQAQLSGADLRAANLKKANLKEANLEEAKLKGAQLQEANLSKANLQGAELSAANLAGANLAGALLNRSSLEGACLRQVEGLTLEQLSKTQSLYKAQLDQALMKQVMKFHRHLLENPSGAFEDNELDDPCQTDSGSKM